MKKIGCYLYNIIFWVSRTITISIFGICFFAVLNAKYVFSELFFSKILDSSLSVSYHIQKTLNIITSFSVLKLSLFIDPIAVKAKALFYKLFCINSQNIDILIYAFISILLIYFTIKYIFKNKKLIFTVILEVFLVYFFIYFFTHNLNFLLLSLISPIFFMIMYLINLYCPFQKIIMLFPLVGEIFCIDNIVLFITKKKQKELFVLINSIIISSILFMFMPYYNNESYNLVIKNDIYSDIYNIDVDNKQDRFAISSYPILLFDNINNKQEIKTKFDLYHQDIVVNWRKEEMYVYSIEEGLLYIIDINTKKEKLKLEILDFEDIKDKRLIDSRCFYDYQNNKILIVFEWNCSAVLIDLDNLKIIRRYYDLLPSNDGVIYNKFRNSFILTYYQAEKTIQELNYNDIKVKNIPMESEQGYIAISEQNKEIYIAFHQQGRIGVYDAETMELKRKIKSNYTVKDITYDEELNVLIAPSYFAGYVDIFLMDGSDKLLKRKFVGYELREARFDTKKENLYVCSRNGLYKIPINIKKLIKESHKNEGVN